MDVLRTGNRTVLTHRIVSARCFVLPTHWNEAVRRTELCPDSPLCPWCRTQRSKRRGYAIAQQKTAKEDPIVGLIEICPELLEQFRHHEWNPAASAGWTWRQQRRESRPGWKLLGATHVPIDPLPDEILPAAIEQLYRLPPILSVDESSNVPITQRDWQLAAAGILLRRLNQGATNR